MSLIKALGYWGSMVGATCCLAQAPAVGNWVGTVTVIAQAGDACVHEPKPPYQRRVMASSELSNGGEGLAGRMFISGDTEGMEATGAAGAFALRALLGGDDAPGTLALSLRGGLLTGRWSEVPSAREGVCSWTQAHIELEPTPLMRGGAGVATPAQVEQVFRLAQGLMKRGAPDEADQAARLLAMLRLGTELAKGGLGNLALAKLYLDTSDRVRLFGQRQDALALIGLSSQLHRLVASEHPQAVAEALSREASALRGLKRRAEAESLYLEALAVLKAKGLQQGETGGSINNSLGTLYLRMGRHADAVAAFKDTLAAQQQWGAPALDVAGTLNNLAHALAKQGHQGAALAVFDDALSRLTDGTDRERSLAEVIRESALALRGGSSQQRELRG